MDDLNPGAGAGGNGGSQLPAGSDGNAGSSPAGSGAGSPPASLDWNTAPQQFREGHTRLQTEHQQTRTRLEPWEKLGKYEDVTKGYQTYQQLSEATTLAQQKGFSAGEVYETIQQHGAEKVLAYLRQQPDHVPGQTPANTNDPAQIQRLIQQQVKQHLKPFEQERQRELDAKAESRFDGEFDRSVKTHFPHGLPDSGKEALQGLAWSLLSDNADAYKALRDKGDMSGVGPAIKAAVEKYLRIVNDHAESERKRVGGNGQQRTEQGNKKPQTLSDLAAALNDETIPLEVALGKR